jgi:hypothetical protein
MKKILWTLAGAVAVYLAADFVWRAVRWNPPRPAPPPSPVTMPTDE